MSLGFTSHLNDHDLDRVAVDLLAADDSDLRSRSLTALLRELGAEPAERWQCQARMPWG